MAQFLTTIGCLHTVEQIIINSKTYLVLVSPYIRLSQNLYERLSEANNRGVEIVVVFGKEDLLKDAREFFTRLDNLACYYHPGLHAKCYFNHEQLLASSMNLYESSNKDRNREMGFLFSAEDDVDVYNEVKRETSSIVKASKVIKSKLAKNVIAYHFDKPDLGELTVRNYYLYELFDILRRQSTRRSISWRNGSIKIDLPFDLHLIIDRRVNLHIPENLQKYKQELYTELQRVSNSYRLYGEDSWNINIYPSSLMTPGMTQGNKETIIENFTTAVQIIENYFNTVDGNR